MALIRARFCELTADLCALDPTEQYLLGMLSLVPAMLRIPMAELTPALPLRAPVREALEGAANREGSPLVWLESHERGDWTASDELVRRKGLDPEQLLKCY